MSGTNEALAGTEHKVGVGQAIKLSDAAEKKIVEVIARYPSKKSAVMPALYLAQEELGWVSPDAIAWVSSRLDLPASHVYEVASFYTMYYKRPVGKFHVQVCRTLSCQLVGARKLTKKLHERFGVGAGEVTADGMWSYEEVECLGSCGTAPLCQINDLFFEKLTPESLDGALDQIAKEQPDLRFSTLNEKLGSGMPAQPRSQIMKDGGEK